MRHFVFSVTDQLYPLLGEFGELYEVELAMAEGVSGQRRRRAVAEQLRGGGSGGTPSPAKELATAPAFPSLLVCRFAYFSLCVSLAGRNHGTSSDKKEPDRRHHERKLDMECVQYLIKREMYEYPLISPPIMAYLNKIYFNKSWNVYLMLLAILVFLNCAEIDR